MMLINFMMQSEHDPERAIRQAEILVRHKQLQEQLKHDPERAIHQAEILARHKYLEGQIRNSSWFSTIATALSASLSRIFHSGHDYCIEQEKM